MIKINIFSWEKFINKKKLCYFFERFFEYKIMKIDIWDYIWDGF